jgi:hypothetical protein
MMQQGLYDPSAARRLKPVKLFVASEIASLDDYPNEILWEDGQENLTLEHEILLEDQTVDGSTPRPDTPEGHSDGDTPGTFLEYGGGLPFERENEIMPSRQGASTFKEWYDQHVVREESDHLPESDRGLLGIIMPPAGVYSEAQPVTDERQGLLYGADPFGTTRLDPVTGDSPLGFHRENSQLILIEDELNCATVVEMHQPRDADPHGITKPSTLMNDSFRVLQGGDDELLLVEDGLFFSEENSAYHQEQHGCEEDEMLF